MGAAQSSLELLGERFVDLALGECSAPQETYRAAWLNFFGLACSGAHEPAVEAFVCSRKGLAPGAYAPLGHEPCLTLPDCIMATCYASSVQAFDDIHFATTTHPAGPVAAAILGVSELVDVPMAAATEALAVGMEVECRLALALFSAGTGSAPGWYTTGMAGGVGAAAAVARLLGLSRAQTASALGWAATAACGVRGTHGFAAGTFVPALAARAGFEAALLARDGLDCGIGALTGISGLIRQVAPRPALDEALAGIGTTWVSAQTSPKPYPFGFVSFAAVDAALELGGVGPGGPIDVYVSPRAARLGGNPHPATSDEAIVSIPYLVTRTLTDPESVRVPIPTEFSVTSEVRRIMSRIELHTDAELKDGMARISVDGGARMVTCGAARGTNARRLATAEVLDKFRSICGLKDPARVIVAVMRDNVLLSDVVEALRQETPVSRNGLDCS